MRFTGERVEVEEVGTADELIRRYAADLRPLFNAVAEADSTAQAIAVRHLPSASVEVMAMGAFRERYWRAGR